MIMSCSEKINECVIGFQTIVENQIKPGSIFFWSFIFSVFHPNSGETIWSFWKNIELRFASRTQVIDTFSWWTSCPVHRSGIDPGQSWPLSYYWRGANTYWEVVSYSNLPVKRQLALWCKFSRMVLSKCVLHQGGTITNYVNSVHNPLKFS